MTYRDVLQKTSNNRQPFFFPPFRTNFAPFFK
jgi:hypothetical protein